ncbi:MAG: FAD-binding oxidoreductase, partial [Myxococcales bacterium]|nr:FAD-binding oxidoreductase [Myxococcales bacterium]
MNEQLEAKLVATVGASHVLREELDLSYYSTDLSMEPRELAAWVVQPGSAEEVEAVVRLAAEAGAPLVPRGGAMSYTHTFVPGRPGCVLLDMRRLDVIHEVSAEDLFVIADCGVTWEQVYLAVSEQGGRTPYWGPLSGRFATVGGTLSNNSSFFGSGRYGLASEAVLGLEVILASGERIRTGAWSHRNSGPFMRYHGPDLTGLFLGDAGALGVKTKAALRLVPLPEATVGLAFECADFDASNACLLEMGRTELAAEVYGFDPLYNGVFADAGFSFLEGIDWTLFVTVDAANDELAEAAASHLREIGLRYGKEIDPSVPLAVRADPFGAVPQVLTGPKGELWIPLHGLFPPSKAKAAADVTMTFMEENASLMAEHGIQTSILTAANGKDFLFEPSFYWSDALGKFRLEKLTPERAEKLREVPPNLPAREVALRLRREL